MTKNILSNEQPCVSVIIAVYKAEAYIERCVRSLFDQTLGNVEYIFIDDCSPDHSFEILSNLIEKYPNRKKLVKVIHHDINKGVAVSRTDGMKMARGEYMIHCDADDWMPTYALELMYNKAVSCDADIVSGRVCTHFHDGEIISRAKTKIESGSSALQKHNFNFSLWLQIIRTSIIQNNEIYPWPGTDYGEDSPVVIRAFALANLVTGVDEITYHYDCTKENSLSKINFDSKMLALDKVFPKLEKWLLANSHLSSKDIERLINTYKLAVKSDFLSKRTRNVKLWYEYWPETFNQYLSNLPIKPRMIFRVGQYLPTILSLYMKYIDWRSGNA